MMQQQQQMAAYAAGTTITTELIQKYLDENKQLILAILDNQNLGQLNECATYQAKLQQNLMYLAAIADAQPQAVQSSPRAAPVPSMQPAQQYLQQQQQQQHQQLMMNQRTPIPQYLQQSQQVSPHLSQHSYHNQQGMVSGAGAGMHLMSGDGSTRAGNGPQSMGGSSEYGNNPSGSRNGNQTMSSAEGGVAGSSPLGHPGRDGGSVHGGDTSSEVSYLQGSEEDAQSASHLSRDKDVSRWPVFQAKEGRSKSEAHNNWPVSLPTALSWISWLPTSKSIGVKYPRMRPLAERKPAQGDSQAPAQFQ